MHDYDLEEEKCFCRMSFSPLILVYSANYDTRKQNIKGQLGGGKKLDSRDSEEIDICGSEN